MSAEGDEANALAAAARDQAARIAAVNARVNARLSQVDPVAYATFRANWAPLEDALSLARGRESLPDDPPPPRGN